MSGLVSAFLFLTISLVGANGLPSKKEIQNLEASVKELRETIAAMKQQTNEARNHEVELRKDLEDRELSFRDRFESVLLPLLNWPHISVRGKETSWTMREHGQFILEDTRARLSQEPLLMIAERELRLRRVEATTEELQQRLNELQEKESLLSLQVEELKLLKKKPNSRSKRLNRGT